jgi:hypothetical protein
MDENLTFFLHLDFYTEEEAACPFESVITNYNSTWFCNSDSRELQPRRSLFRSGSS